MCGKTPKPKHTPVTRQQAHAIEANARTARAQGGKSNEIIAQSAEDLRRQCSIPEDN